MNIEEVKEIRDIVEGCTWASLATCESGRPRVRPVSAFLQEDFSLLVASFSGARKVAQIREENRVEVLFVDGGHAQVRFDGEAVEIADVEEKREIMDSTLSADMWKKYFSGPEDPNFTLFRITASRIEWNRTGEVKYRVLDS
ncbi:MAG: pyridoxamine 5'-phosphate oxidase family protein [Planctomycetota bacterium]